ncbi:MAG: MotA/TolQ/ExbB proton channel family protein [Lentisphaeria bacterium]|nr:MotA/TolQ/ExbB proton channel family protein [Lentisphaeria bacterium]
MNLWSNVLEAGPIMWLLLFCSVIAVFIFIGKWFQFHRNQVNVKELVGGLINVLTRNGMIEALTLCDNTPGPVARILTAGIQAHHDGDDIQHAIDDAVLVELPRLESNLSILGTIAKVAPMLGLLGAVLNMYTAAGKISQQGVQMDALFNSLTPAILTTAAGLALAIPCLIAYNYLVARVETFCIEMEKASSEIIYFFERKDAKNGSETQS